MRGRGQDLYTVAKDGGRWIWRRYAVPCGIYASREGWATKAEAEQAAQTMAATMRGVYLPDLERVLRRVKG